MPPSRLVLPRCAAAPSINSYNIHNTAPGRSLFLSTRRTTQSRSQQQPSQQPPTAMLARLFTTTTRLPYRQQRVPSSTLPIPSPTATEPAIPPYPYGPRLVYKQSNTGLYGAARIRFGNNVSAKHGVRTRRKWRPNVHAKRLWSDALGAFVRTRVTTRVLRSVDKAGGLDEYLLGGKAARLRELGPWGWRLRWRVMQTDAVRARFAAERAALGLPPLETASSTLAAAAGEEALPAELEADGLTSEELRAEVDGMVAREEEFAFGADAELVEDAAGELAKEEGFMKEEPAPSSRR